MAIWELRALYAVRSRIAQSRADLLSQVRRAARRDRRQDEPFEIVRRQGPHPCAAGSTRRSRLILRASTS